MASKSAPTSSETPRLRGEQPDVRPGDALIVVDVQRDFLPGGALAVERGDEVIERLNDYMNAVRAVNAQPGDDARAIREMIGRGAALYLGSD